MGYITQLNCTDTSSQAVINGHKAMNVFWMYRDGWMRVCECTFKFASYLSLAHTQIFFFWSHHRMFVGERLVIYWTLGRILVFIFMLTIFGKTIADRKMSNG